MKKFLVFMMVMMWTLSLNTTWASNVRWTNAGGTGLWNDADNWNPEGVPTETMVADYPWIYGDFSELESPHILAPAVCDKLAGPGFFGSSSLIIDGSTLTIPVGHQYMVVGFASGNTGTIKVKNGGVLNGGPGTSVLGREGAAVLNITESSTAIFGNVNVAYNIDNPANVTGSCEINIIDGTFQATMLNHNNLIDSRVKINITPETGELILTNGAQTPIASWIENGMITGVGDGVEVWVSWDGPTATIQSDAGIRYFAHDPQPLPGSTGITRDVALTWIGSVIAEHHDIYFGTNFDDVSNADEFTAGIYRGRQNAGVTSYTPPEVLELETTYYWRVDEIKDGHVDSPWKGTVWSFTTGDYVPIDDFEEYNNIDPATQAGYEPPSSRYPAPAGTIWEQWKDGYELWAASAGSTGSIIYDSGTTHHLYGSKSLKFNYDNAGSVDTGEETYSTPYYSEICRAYTTPQDWTIDGVEALYLYYLGSSGNDSQPMYLTLSDGVDVATVVNPDPNMAVESWRTWSVDLQDFADANVDLHSISSVYIGFGDKNNPKAGGSGTVYFDNIRLYPPMCISTNPNLSAADFNKDCIVDTDDFYVMASDWMQHDTTIAGINPVNEPVGWWKLDESSGTTAHDSSAIENHGALAGNATWVNDPDRGWCLSTDGLGDWVTVPDDPNQSQTMISEGTVSAWVKLNGSYRQAIVSKMQSLSTGNWCLITGSDSAPSFVIHRDGASWMSRNHVDKSGAAVTDEWVNYIGVFDNSNLYLYENGILIGKTPKVITPTATTQPLYIGRWQPSFDWALNGLISDVRIYDYALSQSEILGLVGTGDLYTPVLSEANLYDEEPENSKSVNLRDFAVLASDWMNEVLWP